MNPQPENDFEKLAADQEDQSLLSELIDFLRFNKKWWLGPIVGMLLLIAVLLLLSSSAAAPFIYTLF